MITSILDNVKKNLGIQVDDDEFDNDIITHINTVFFTLNQLGIGPSDGYMIEDNTTEWDDYTDGVKNLNAIKTYTYLRVRALFDPPQTGYLTDALKEQIRELEVRLSMNREDADWVGPVEDEIEDGTILDGGSF